ncbi:MAG: hypothetical protein II759_03155 [Lachnospiraceae bacterium]|nr:hypothetical protein [Lachnospiraceae bacterium]
MREFYQLAQMFRTALMLMMHLACCIYFYIGIRCIQQRRPVWMRAAAVFFAAVCAAMQRLIVLEGGEYAEGPAGYGFPSFPLVLAPALLLILAAILLWNIRYWKKNHITSASVKESFDALPEGICFYWEGGLPKLVNARMQELSAAIAGGNLRDAESFTRLIRSGELPSGVSRIPREDGVLIRLADGRSFSFRHAVRKLENHDIHELIAVDVTEEYRIYETLEEKREKAGEYNRRLKELNRSITVMSMEKEMLQTKIRIHDEFGRALLMAKKYLLSPSAADRQEMLRLWKRTTMLIGGEEPETWQMHLAPGAADRVPEGTAAPDSAEETERSREDFSGRLHRRAGVLGVGLALTGPLPVSEEAQRILQDAVDTHVTNTVRHAGGSRIEVRTAREGGSIRVEMTNDGDPPAGEIREAGGLKNLRSEIERAGGSMSVSASPGFLLEFTIPDPAEGK